MVEITKLRTNYKLRYNYLGKLSSFIKELPRDQFQVKMDPIMQEDGSIKEDWYRLVSDNSIGKIIDFIKDNNIPFKFTNLTPEEINTLKNEHLARKTKTSEILKLKTEEINVDNEDFSFLKIQPHKYQKQAVVFFDKCNGNAILGDSPGVGKTMSAMAYGTKNKYKTLVICPASLKLNWRNEVLKFTNEKAYVYKWKPGRKSDKINYSKEESLFHIINYEAIETYAKFNIHHKCSRCGWEEVNLKRKIRECPKCGTCNSIKSKQREVNFVEDKNNIGLNPKDYDLLVVDECFPYETIVKTERGDLKIGDIVEQNLNIKVLSYNIKADTIEYKEIDRWIEKNNSKNLLKIKLEDGSELVCTPNHKIYIKELGYIRADEIKKGNVLFYMPDESFELLQLKCEETIDHIEEINKVYNLEIRDNHNYFANNILVSNCHYLKSSKANRTKTVKTLFRDTPRKLLLTGTAIKSKPYEFFSILNFLDPKTWKNAHHFGIRYGAGEETAFGWTYDGASNLEELYERISPYFLRRLKKDVLQFLPPKTYTNIPIELSSSELKEYRDLENNAIKESSETDDDYSHLARIQHLKRFTSNLKLEKALGFIENIIDGDEKIVVFSQYVGITEAVAQKFGDKAVVYTGKKSQDEKQEAVDRFMNDDKVKVFAGTIGAAGQGITLTSANITMFIDCAWTPGDMEQAEDRIHRASTTADNVQIIKLICEGTIDEDIQELLERKSQILSRVLDGIEFERIENRSIFKDLVRILLDKKNKL